MRGAKESHNRWWAKRLVYEGAGWPDALDKSDLRRRVRDLEKARSDAFDGGSGYSSGLAAENKLWREAAGSHAV